MLFALDAQPGALLGSGSDPPPPSCCVVAFIHEAASIHLQQILFVNQCFSWSHYIGTPEFPKMMQSCQRGGVKLTLELESRAIFSVYLISGEIRRPLDSACEAIWH